MKNPSSSKRPGVVLSLRHPWALCILIAGLAVTITAFLSCPSYAFADDSFTLGEAGGYLEGSLSVGSRSYVERRFSDPQGHGFAAEIGNNFIDRLKGIDAKVVGGDNGKNGPDRKIINRDGSVTWIQDKYYSSASGSVSAAFDSETGTYRYLKDGKPMQLEVPSDQYDDAVQLMREKIENGKVPGVSDPSEAESLVRKGSLSYKQAVNLTKAGNATSLAYDSAHGVVSSTCAFGISFGIDFVLCVKDGASLEEAISEASSNAVLSGASVFASEVITSQLMKTGLSEALAPSTEAVARWLGDDACKAILNSAKVSADEIAHMSAKDRAKRASKILKGQVVLAVITTAIMTAPDAKDVLEGRMSKEQFVKNLATVVAGIVGATVGGAAGSEIPVLGNTAGAIVGGLVGAGIAITVAEVTGDALFKDDSEKMYEIVSEKFSGYCEEYLASKSEAESLAEAVSEKLGAETLKDMFATDDRDGFVESLLKPMFEELAGSRTYAEAPSEYEVRSQMLNDLDGVVFIH